MGMPARALGRYLLHARLRPAPALPPDPDSPPREFGGGWAFITPTEAGATC